MADTMIGEVIKRRRTVKPSFFNGKHLNKEEVIHLLELADWAPTHKHSEPWRFLVFGPERVADFCLGHAALYKAHTPEDQYEAPKFEKLLHLGDRTSHLIVVYMKRSVSPKLPEWEELAATACAVQNILLGAEAAGIAAFWSTGGMTNHAAIKPWLNLNDDETPVGLLYLGYTDSVPNGTRRIPLQDKIRWEE